MNNQTNPQERESVVQIALIDFDNIIPTHESRTDLDLESKIIKLKNTLIRSTNLDETFIELRIYIYGGWIDNCGKHTKRFEQLQRNIYILRTREKSHRLIPQLSLAIQSVRDFRLIGTLRQVISKDGKRSFSQKMVDSMMVVDAIYWADKGKTVHIFSDDDDIIPGAMEASRRSPLGNYIYFHRNRDEANGLNIRELSKKSNIIIKKIDLGD